MVATDFNNDGRMDLFVANDTVQNFLFANRGLNEWDEVALVSGVGFSDSGQARSGMGVDAVDLHRRGWEDLFVANVDQEMFSLSMRTIKTRHSLTSLTSTPSRRPLAC